MNNVSGIIRSGALALSLAGLGIASLGIDSTAVHAQPNNGEGTKACKLVTGPSVNFYPPGTTITVTNEDGSTSKFRCNGNSGEWDPAIRASLQNKQSLVGTTFDGAAVVLH